MSKTVPGQSDPPLRLLDVAMFAAFGTPRRHHLIDAPDVDLTPEAKLAASMFAEVQGA